jgi:hypothetical protein
LLVDPKGGKCKIVGMKTSEPLPMALTELLNLCEKFYFERCALEAILKEFGPLDWQEKYQRILARSDLQARVRAIFCEAAERLKHASTAEETLSILLRHLPSEGKPN